MSNRTEQPNVRNIVANTMNMANRPAVAILVDGSDWKFAAEGGNSLAEHLVNFAGSIGTITRSALFVRSFPESANRWSSNGFEIVTKKDGTPETKVSVPLIVEAMVAGTLRPYIRVLVVSAYNCSIYEDLFAELCTFGITTVAVNVDSSLKIVKSNNPLITYISLDELENLPKDMQISSPAYDLSDYDFSKFIELLEASEEKMPFVGVRFFINKVMWRLGDVDQQACQEIFHQAEEHGIIELYKSANINTDSPEVSACKLNRENATVRAALEGYVQDDLAVDSSDYDDGNFGLDEARQNATIITYSGSDNSESVTDTAPTVNTTDTLPS